MKTLPEVLRSLARRWREDKRTDFDQDLNNEADELEAMSVDDFESSVTAVRRPSDDCKDPLFATTILYWPTPGDWSTPELDNTIATLRGRIDVLLAERRRRS